MEVFTIPDDGPSALEAAAAEMELLRTALATGSIRLWTDPAFTPNGLEDLALMQEKQSVFPGYTAGGIAIDTVPEAYLADDGLSYLVTLNSVQFNRSAAAGDPVLVHGAYVVDKDDVLRGVRKFAAPVTMENALDSLPVVITIRKR